jgi:hypothetical protein
MIARPLLFAALVAALPLSTDAQFLLPPPPPPHVLAVEGGGLSLSTSYQGDFPAGSGVRNRGELGDDAGALGISFEYRAGRNIGLRAGLLVGRVAMRGESSCAPCVFRSPSAIEILESGHWSVDGTATAGILLLELPLILAPRPSFELFAGPTLARVELGNVGARGPEGLAVDLRGSDLTLGFHLGGRAHPGAGRWSIGAIARWMRTEIDLALRQPGLTVQSDFGTVEREEDMITFSLMVGRRFNR